MATLVPSFRSQPVAPWNRQPQDVSWDYKARTAERHLMRYTVTFLETQYAQLTSHLFGGRNASERAAYLRCGLSETSSELRLLVRQVIAVSDADLLSQSAD